MLSTDCILDQPSSGAPYNGFACQFAESAQSLSTGPHHCIISIPYEPMVNTMPRGARPPPKAPSNGPRISECMEYTPLYPLQCKSLRIGVRNMFPSFSSTFCTLSRIVSLPALVFPSLAVPLRFAQFCHPIHMSASKSLSRDTLPVQNQWTKRNAAHFPINRQLLLD